MADTTDWDNDILGADEVDETIIELTDVVEEGLDTPIDEEIIELTDIVEEESQDLNLDIVKEEEPVAEEGLEFEEDIELQEDVSFEEELEIEIDDAEDEAPVEPEPVAEPSQSIDVSSEMLVAAVESIVEKKFADKIETILFEVMEKVIEKEIKEIKESLQKDLDQIGNA